jgi:hypothetical protein
MRITNIKITAVGKGTDYQGGGFNKNGGDSEQFGGGEFSDDEYGGGSSEDAMSAASARNLMAAISSQAQQQEEEEAMRMMMLASMEEGANKEPKIEVPNRNSEALEQDIHQKSEEFDALTNARSATKAKIKEWIDGFTAREGRAPNNTDKAAIRTLYARYNTQEDQLKTAKATISQLKKQLGMRKLKDAELQARGLSEPDTTVKPSEAQAAEKGEKVKKKRVQKEVAPATWQDGNDDDAQQKASVDALIAKHKAAKEAKLKDKEKKNKHQKKEKKDKHHKKDKKEKKTRQIRSSCKHVPNRTCEACGQDFYSASGNSTACTHCRSLTKIQHKSNFDEKSNTVETHIARGVTEADEADRKNPEEKMSKEVSDGMREYENQCGFRGPFAECVEAHVSECDFSLGEASEHVSDEEEPEFTATEAYEARDLPPGWQEAWDGNDDLYYTNTEIGEWQWEYPVQTTRKPLARATSTSLCEWVSGRDLMGGKDKGFCCAATQVAI